LSDLEEIHGVTLEGLEKATEKPLGTFNKILHAMLIQHEPEMTIKDMKKLISSDYESAGAAVEAVSIAVNKAIEISMPDETESPNAKAPTKK
jgi:hypothetical protein